MENRSEGIGALAAALSKAQGMIKGAIKDSENPFFKSSYADLSSVWDACREPLSVNGLAVVQVPHESSDMVIIETFLIHSSGEWISGKISMKPVKTDPQSWGSCLTYARRYSLSAIVGIAPLESEDDDGNLASGKEPSKKPKTNLDQAYEHLRPEEKKPRQDFDFLKKCGEAKKQLKALTEDDGAYYETLAAWTCGHANQVKEEDRVNVLNDLRNKYKAIKAEAGKEDKK